MLTRTGGVRTYLKRKRSKSPPPPRKTKTKFSHETDEIYPKPFPPPRGRRLDLSEDIKIVNFPNPEWAIQALKEVERNIEEMKDAEPLDPQDPRSPMKALNRRLRHYKLLKFKEAIIKTLELPLKGGRVYGGSQYDVELLHEALKARLFDHGARLKFLKTLASGEGIRLASMAAKSSIAKAILQS